MTLNKQEQLMDLPGEIDIPGFRRMVKKDSAQVLCLLKKELEYFTIALKFLRKYLLYPNFTEEEFQHFFAPKEDIVDTYVVEEKKGDSEYLITDFISFYTIPSTVIKHDTIKEIKVSAFY